MDEFMEAVHDVFPDMVVQFEDFESQKAFDYLDRYRNQYKCFVSRDVTIKKYRLDSLT